MKDFEYYTKVNVRHPASTDLWSKNRARYLEELKIYQESYQEKIDEFWQDVRKDLGYAHYIGEDSAKRLENEVKSSFNGEPYEADDFESLYEKTSELYDMIHMSIDYWSVNHS